MRDRSELSANEIRGNSFTALRDIAPIRMAELLVAVEKAHAAIRTRPARRHKVVAFSEAQTPGMWKEKLYLGIIKPGKIKTKTGEVDVRDWCFAREVFERFLAPPERNDGDLVGWKEKDFPDFKWNALSAGKWSEAERKRRITILKHWTWINRYAPASILPHS